MPLKQIDEFSPLASITGVEIIHTKDTGGVDSTMTAQQIADLVPSPAAPFDPASNVINTPAAADLFVLLDASQSNDEGTATVAQIQSLLGLTTATGNLTTIGNFNIGGLELRWGTYVSNTDSLQTIQFNVVFPNECFGVYISPQLADSQHPVLVAGFNITEFTSNRTNLLSGDITTTYFALGF